MNSRLPLLVEFHEDESLISLITTIAFKLGVSRDQLARSIGIGPDLVDPRTRLRRLSSERLPAREITALAIAFDLPEERVFASTIASLDARALQLDHQGKLPARHTLWTQSTRSRVCPDCIAETGGARRLLHRTAWSFACLKHRRLLLDTCPWCQRPIPITSAPTVHSVVDPQHCGASSPGEARGTHCTFDLALTAGEELPEDHPALKTQVYIQKIITGPLRNPDVREILMDLRAVSIGLLAGCASDEIAERGGFEPSLLRGLWEPPERFGTAPPEDTLFTAALLTAADAILRADSPEQQRELLEPLMWSSMARISETTPTARLEMWGPHSAYFTRLALPLLDRHMVTFDRLRYQSMSATPAVPTTRSEQHASSRRDYIPQLFWPEATFILADRPGIDGDAFRGVLSACLSVVGSTSRSASTVLSQLGWGGDAPLFRTELLGDHTRLEATLLLLTSLAKQIDRKKRGPINYAARRRLDFTHALPAEAWTDFCLRVEIPAGGAARHRAAWLFLARRISGNAKPCGAPSMKTVGAEHFTRFLLDLNGRVLGHFDAYGRHLLNRVGMQHEPVAAAVALSDDASAGLLARQLHEIRRTDLDLALSDGIRRLDDLIDISGLNRLQLRLLMEASPPGPYETLIASKMRVKPGALLTLKPITL